MNVRLTIGRNVIIYGEGSIPLPPGNESGSVLIANSATPGDASFKTLEDAGIAKQADLVQLAGGVSLLDKILILQRGQILSNSIRQYVPFSVKQNDVVHAVTSNVDLIITDPKTQYYSISLTKDESLTDTQVIVLNQAVEKDVYIVANSDYEYVYLYVNPNTGVVSYDVKIEIIPFEKLKDWILSEAYTVSDMTYDSFGNVKTAQLTYPDATGGVIQTSTSDAEGRLLTMIFTYGKPAIIYLQMTITYLGDLVDTITINKV